MLIFGGILVFLALLLTCPVWAAISYEEKLSLRVGYLFLSFRLFPPKEKKKPEKQRKKAREQKTAEKTEDAKKRELLDILKQKGLSGFLSLLSQAASLAASTWKGFVSHLYVSRLKLSLTVAAEDAAGTALLYGRVCGVVYPAFRILTETARCRKPEIQVSPNFQKDKTEISFACKARIPLFFLLWEALRALVGAVSLWRRAVEPEESDKKTV